jgi:hypothetical protein
MRAINIFSLGSETYPDTYQKLSPTLSILLAESSLTIARHKLSSIQDYGILGIIEDPKIIGTVIESVI